MNRAKSSGDLSSPGKVQESLDCVVDKLKFDCVWKQPDMAAVNQFIDEMTILDGLDDKTFGPSDLLDLISGSFLEASSVEEGKAGDDSTLNHSAFEASTPCHKGSKESSAKRRNDKLVFEESVKLSPISSSPLHEKVYKVEAPRLKFFTRKQLQLSFDYETSFEIIQLDNSRIRRQLNYSKN